MAAEVTARTKLREIVQNCITSCLSLHTWHVVIVDRVLPLRTADMGSPRVKNTQSTLLPMTTTCSGPGTMRGHVGGDGAIAVVDDAPQAQKGKSTRNGASDHLEWLRCTLHEVEKASSTGRKYAEVADVRVFCQVSQSQAVMR